jgi:hypothetical protein
MNHSWAYIRRNVSQQTRETLICTPRFIASLFTIAKLWNQPRCPSTDECIKKLWYGSIHNGVLFSHKKTIMSFSGKWMDLEIIMLSEISQTENDKYHMLSLVCRI